NNCLPFTSNMAIGGLGTDQDTNFQFCGGGSGWVHAGDENRVDPATGFEAAATAGRIKSYTRMGSATGNFDRVVYFITRYSTEGRDIYQRDYYLYDWEKNDINALANLVGVKNVVVMLNVPSVIDTTWLIEKGVGALAVVWMGGEQAGNSIADVCTGVVSPSGKLADTWAKDLQYYPTIKNSWWDSVTNLTTLQNSKNDFGEFGNVRYEEDIYVGYRYFETFDPTYQTVNFEFGYGLSYTTFNIDVTGVNINKNLGKIKVFAKVTNTGKFAGKEVVQVYYSTPNDVIDSPSKQLIAFEKTETLQPNASQTLTLEFDINEMSQFDDLGKIKLDAFVLQRGDYNIYVGNSIKDSNKRLVATYQQTSNQVILETSHLTTNLDRRLTSDGTYDIINKEGYEVKAAGMSVIQAEDYFSSSHYSESTGDWNMDEIVNRHEIGMSSGMHIRRAENKTFRYKLYVEKAGTYNIDFIMANGSGATITNNFSLFLDYTDDATDNGTNQNLTVNVPSPNTDWNNYQRISGKTITFTQAGECFMTIKTHSPCANFDYFVIYNNNVSATKVTQITAPNFTSAVNTENSDQAPTPEASIYGTCLGFLHSGRVVEYTLNVEKAGDYYLDFDASSCGYASSEVAIVSINGVAQSTKVAMMRTACSPQDQGVPIDHYFYFDKTNQMQVTLPAGTVTLKLEFLNSAITNLRSINFTPVALGARSYTYTDNTAYWNLQTTFASDGVGLDLGFKYIDVVQGKCTVEQFLNQMHSSELAYMTGLYTGSDVTGDGVNEPRLEDVNSGVGGFGGVLGTALVDYYGIPYAATADGPAGIRFINENDTAISEFYRRSTYFPCITMLSSTWNKDLAYEFGRAYGAEAQAVGIEVMLAPGMNIHRSPLGGRNFEYISEDPFITGTFATYITLGCQSRGVSVSGKNIAANSQENNRFNQDTKVSARALREIYLKGFEMVIKNANPGTMMTSYNYVNGTSTAEHYELLTNVVRNEWGWEGVIESDWSENVNDCTMVNAGNNLHSCVIHYDQIELGYKLRLLDKAKLVENASYVIKFLIRSQASSLSATRYPEIEAATKITCTDGSGRVWEPMEMTNIQIINESKSVWEAGLATGIHGDARLELSDETNQISWTSANSGVYGAIAVEKGGDYYLAYTLNIGAIAEKYGKFNLYIDGVLVDTFTNPNKLKSTAEWGTEDWVSEDIFFGDSGSKKVTLKPGVHRIYIDILD
ncbi:MAG: glycoside hydrolase family 3 C-terminal domain-containing protein, partial [Clostridia bacterium]|nr:glycoside hydrolase family 3 C-terminal domain-containing protein [Clostridia bacterium]